MIFVVTEPNSKRQIHRSITGRSRSQTPRTVLTGAMAASWSSRTKLMRPRNDQGVKDLSSCRQPLKTRRSGTTQLTLTLVSTKKILNLIFKPQNSDSVQFWLVVLKTREMVRHEKGKYRARKTWPMPFFTFPFIYFYFRSYLFLSLEQRSLHLLHLLRIPNFKWR